MKFPWSHRAEKARAEREKTHHKLQRVREDWPKIAAEVAVTRSEREKNGWTATVETLFAGRHS